MLQYLWIVRIVASVSITVDEFNESDVSVTDMLQEFQNEKYNYETSLLLIEKIINHIIIIIIIFLYMFDATDNFKLHSYSQ